MRNTVISICFILSAFSGSFAQNKIILPSPDGRIQFIFYNGEQGIRYDIRYNQQALIQNSSLGLDFENGAFGNNLKINKPNYRTGDETYNLVVGKTKTVHSHYREVIIPLEEKQSPFRKINLAIRAFDDGLAFRYEYPSQQAWDNYTLWNENDVFNVVGNPRVTALFLPSYTSSHEGLYTVSELKDLKENKLMDMPVLFEFPGDVFMSVTEAALVDYAGMYLMKENGVLKSKLSPYPGQEQVKVKASLPHHSPWRVFMIGNRIGALIESNILTNLNEPCKITDTSWIQPGKATWPWWNGNITPDTTFNPGNNFETNKYFIDFCADNGLEYHSVVEYGNHEWYTNDRFGFFPGKQVDVTTPVWGLDMKRVCDYAKSRGVKIRVWVHWAALQNRVEEAFAKMEEWGVTGMMVDFMDRDDQEMIRFQEEVLQKGAQHKLHIQFHGSSKPSGLHRTYPNEFTREGTLNYEVYKWDTLINANHDIHIPFTRMLAGPTDYHLGGFRAVPASKFKVQYTRPLVTSTRCHMLAMYVVLETYLSLACDYPQAYLGQPGFDFLSKVPASWDQTVVPDAKVNEFVTIARRKGTDWYVGTITDSRERTVKIPLNFLDPGTYIADIYTDASDVAVNPNHLDKQTKEITQSDQLELKIAANGGAAIHIRKK